MILFIFVYDTIFTALYFYVYVLVYTVEIHINRLVVLLRVVYSNMIVAIINSNVRFNNYLMKMK